MVVQDREHAVHVLKQVLKKEKAPNVFHGKVPREFTGQKAIEQYGQDLLNKSMSLRENRSKYQEILFALADFYCQGYQLDWPLLFGEPKLARIHLPTYPFAREEYWVSVGGGRDVVRANNYSPIHSPQPSTVIHPLLHQNTSVLTEQRYSSSFTGAEFFFAGHGVNGQKVLPEVAILEMARAAIEQAAGAETDRVGIRLNDLVWIHPIGAKGEPIQVNIGLYPEDNGDIRYQIYSDHEAKEEGPVIYSQGSAVLTPMAEKLTLDLKALQTECNERFLSATEIYAAYKTMGIEYGPDYQIIEEIYIRQGQALVKLSLPSSGSSMKEQFILHPGIDSAIQAAMVFKMNSSEIKPASPVNVTEIEVFGKEASIVWALIRYHETAGKSKEPEFKIDLCDEQGTVRARLVGYSQEVPATGIEPVLAQASSKSVMLQFDWNEQPIAVTATASEYNRRLVILCEMNGMGGASEEVSESLATALNGVQCLVLQSKQKSIAERFQTYVIQVFEAIKSIFSDQPSGNILVQIVVPSQGEGELCSGFSGLLKTAQAENPKFTGQLIEMDPMENLAGIVAKLEENRRSPHDIQIRYQDGKRWVGGWTELKTSREVEAIPWRDGGVYLITGGAGGLGIIFANEIAAQVKNATLILTGRSLLSEHKLVQIKELEKKCARVIYRQVDVSDRKATGSLIQSIREEFGGLQGIIHCAGLIRDNYIIKKTKEEILEVLAPKVSGLVNLDQASKDLSLDFMVLFSSIAGSFGNPGQADYSAANAFMDAYAGYRNDLASRGQRRGLTLAINWPLWKEGGIRLDQESQKLMTQTTGLTAMNTRTGIRALYQGMISGKDQVMVLEGDLQTLQSVFFGKQSLSETFKTEAVIASGRKRGRRPEMKGLSLEQCLEWDLKWFINRLLKIPREKIDSEKNLAEFGFNSMGLTQFAIQLIKHYGIQ